jgi:membrane protease YdiL (CAAX protease family)
VTDVPLPRRPRPDVPPPPPGAWPLAPSVRMPSPTGPAWSGVQAPVGVRTRVAAGLGLSAAAIAVYFAGQFVLQLVATLFLIIVGLGDAVVLDPSALAAEDRSAATVLLVVLVLSQLAGVAAVLLLMRWKKVPLRPLVGPLEPLGRHLGIGVGFGVVALVASTTVVGILVALTGSEATAEQILTGELVDAPVRIGLAVLATVVIAPLAEEVIFRGLLHRSLRRRLSLVPATLISSVLFAVVHVDVALSQPLALVGLAVVGVILALAYERTGSLVVPVVIHAVHNAITIALVVVLGRLDIGAASSVGTVLRAVG